MSEPTPRQVLYALVAAGFMIVVMVLVVGSAVAGLSPTWWTVVMGITLVGATIWSILNWRRTAPVLMISIMTLIVWTAGTLLVT
jgi:hypothetical protein